MRPSGSPCSVDGHSRRSGRAGTPCSSSPRRRGTSRSRVCSSSPSPASFVQALLAMGYRPIPLSGDGKVVDIAIQRTAEALLERDADVMLVSHDNDFTPEMEALARDDDRRLGVVGFGEFMAGGLRQI